MNNLLHRFVVFSVVLLNACQQSGNKTMPAVTEDEIKQESKSLLLFLDSIYETNLSRNPEMLSYLGSKNRSGEWTDRSDSFAVKEAGLHAAQLTAMKQRFNFDKLDEQSKISFRLFEYEMDHYAGQHKWRFHNYPVNQMDGVQQGIPSLLINYHPVDSLPDAEAYIQRLEKIPSLMEQILSGLKKRDSMGIVPPLFVFDLVVNDCRSIITGQPFQQVNRNSPLYDDFIHKVQSLKTVDGNTKSGLIQHCKKALLTSVQPAFEDLIYFLREQEKKAAIDDGCWKWPDGDKYYAFALEQTTTTDLSPEEIFSTGQKEVARIQAEMKKIVKAVNYKSENLHQFYEYLRTDSRFSYPNTATGRQAYRDLATGYIDTLRGKLDLLFYTKPRAGIVVKPVEPFREQSTGGAFYEQPSEDGSRPGVYYINLYNMADQPIYQAEALAYHEGIPGHHMQIAIAMELENIPKFRKMGGNVAYAEGWALYAELIPKEIGLYQDPYSDFGRLANEVFRAARLVVDVGIHYKKWTRQQALDYFLKNVPNPEGDCRKEIDRYIVWPSQATGYKIGMLRIQELRALAEKELGSAFDLKQFHDVLLTNGPLPLSLLTENVKAWIDKTKKHRPG